MKPTQFPQATKDLAKPQNWNAAKDGECGSLPVHCDGQVCLSLWAMTWKERLQVLFYGRIWLFVFSGNTQPPVSLSVERDVFSEVDGNEKTQTEAEAQS